ncbi:MAG: hypothetical protein ACFFCD_12830 [Promethearchaeota archaeon]
MSYASSLFRNVIGRKLRNSVNDIETIVTSDDDIVMASINALLTGINKLITLQRFQGKSRKMP